jgi:hypothetical protein
MTPRRWPWIGFCVLQLVFATAVLGWGAIRAGTRMAQTRLPELQPEPYHLPPLYDNGAVVTDEQLERVLSRLGCQFRGEKTNIYDVDHSLRFWGPDAEFSHPGWMSGGDMRQLLTDHRRFREVYGAAQDPLLIDVRTGIRVRVVAGHAGSSHVDHTLACLAEAGTPLDFPIVTPYRTATVREMVVQSLRDFSLNQDEYEWSALTYALFLPPHRAWTTAEGQRVSFDLLADRLVREDLPFGVCYANHRFHALVVFLRIDDLMDERGQTRILSPDVRQLVIQYLQTVTGTLVSRQHPEGYWDPTWANADPQPEKFSELTVEQIRSRVIITGHSLEWWALAPAEIHPPRPTLAAAGQWLVHTVERFSDEEVCTYIPFLSHVGNALALWRGRFPVDVLRSLPLTLSNASTPPAPRTPAEPRVPTVTSEPNTPPADQAPKGLCINSMLDE